MSQRLSYVKYDERSVAVQDGVKRQCELLEKWMEELPDGRAKSLALTKLEEFYMWVGKAIRDDQIARTGKTEEQPERKNG